MAKRYFNVDGIGQVEVDNMDSFRSWMKDNGVASGNVREFRKYEDDSSVYEVELWAEKDFTKANPNLRPFGEKNNYANIDKAKIEANLRKKGLIPGGRHPDAETPRPQAAEPYMGGMVQPQVNKKTGKIENKPYNRDLTREWVAEESTPEKQEYRQKVQEIGAEQEYLESSGAKKYIDERENLIGELEKAEFAAPPPDQPDAWSMWADRQRNLVERVNYLSSTAIPYRLTGMTAAEREQAAMYEDVGRNMPLLGATLLSVGHGAMGLLYKGANLLVGAPLGLAAEAVGIDTKGAFAPDNWIIKTLDSRQAGLQAGMKGKGQFWADLGSGFYSLPMSAAIMGEIALTGQASLSTALTQGMITSDIYTGYLKDDGYLSTREAWAGALSGAAQTVIEVAFDASNVKALRGAYAAGGAAGMEAASRKMISETIWPSFKTYLKTQGSVTFHEIAEEVTQETVDILSDHFIAGKPLPSQEEMAERYRSAVFGAFYGSLILGGAGGAIQLQQSRVLQKQLQTLADNNWDSARYLIEAHNQFNAGDIAAAEKSHIKAYESAISEGNAQNLTIVKGLANVRDAINTSKANTALRNNIQVQALVKEVDKLQAEAQGIGEAQTEQQFERLSEIQSTIEQHQNTIARLEEAVQQDKETSEIYNLLVEGSQAEQKARKAGDKAVDKLVKTKEYKEATPEQQRQMMKDAVLSDKKSAKLQEKADQKYRDADLYKLRQTPAYKQAAPEVQTQMEEAELQRQQEARDADIKAAEQRAISEQQEAEKTSQTQPTEATEDNEIVPDIIDQLEAKKAALRQERQDINKELNEYRKLMDQQGGWLPSVTPEQKKAYHEVKQRQKEVNRKLNEVGVEIRKKKANRKKAEREAQKPKKQPKKSKKAEAKETETKEQEKPEPKKEAPQKEKEPEQKEKPKETKPDKKTETEPPAIEPYTPSARMSGGDKLRTEKFNRLYRLEKLRDAGVKRVKLGSATVGIETAIKRTENSLDATSQSEYREWKKKRDTPIDADKIAVIDDWKFTANLSPNAKYNRIKKYYDQLLEAKADGMEQITNGYGSLRNIDEVIAFTEQTLERYKPPATEKESKPEPKKTQVEKKSAEKAEDFGEKIGGARKDVWGNTGLAIKDLENLNEREKAKYITKDNVFPKLDYVKLVADGVPQDVVYWMKIWRDALSPKPTYQKNETSEEISARQTDYVEELRLIMGKIQGVKTKEEALTAQKDIYAMLKERQASGKKLRSVVDAYGRARKVNNIQYKTTNWNYYITRQAKILGIGEKSETKIPAGFSVIKGEGQTDYAAVRGNMILKEGFESEDAAIAYIKQEFGKRKTKTISATPPQLQHIKREGGRDIRKGNNATGENFLETFKFRGGEFGNWMGAADRRESLNMGFDALIDMADALGISPNAISFYGDLSIAFGARGHGRSAAHYEPERTVINLTKMNGAGSLAHEWGHALDDYIGRMFGKKTFATQNRDTLAAMKDIVSLMYYGTTDEAGVRESGWKRSKFMEDARSLDKNRSKPYWSTMTEMFARAFAAYVSDRVEGRSDYLVGHANWEILDGGKIINTSPQGEERTNLNNAFDRLIADINLAKDTRTTGDVDAARNRLVEGNFKYDIASIPRDRADDALLGMVKSHILSITRKDRTTTVNFKDGRKLVINHITQEAMMTEAGKTGVMYAGRTQGEKGKNVYKAIVDLVDGLNQGNRTLFHESFHVVWKLFLNSEQISYINQYYRAKANKGELVRKYVVTRQGTEMALYWTKEQFNALNRERQAEALEEGAAYGFEHWLGSRTDTAPTTMIGKLWQRLADAIRHALVKLNLANQNAKLTDIFHAIASDKLTGQGEQGAEQRNMLSNAYHGSGAFFDRFDVQFVGTGEGAQAFGWGIYVTEREGVAKSYAEKLGMPSQHNLVPAMDIYRNLDLPDVALARTMRKIFTNELGLGGNPEKAIKSVLEFLDNIKYHGANSATEPNFYYADNNALINDVDRLKSLTTVNTFLLNYQPGQRNLYTVNIWENRQEDVLEWDGKPTQEQINKIVLQFSKEGREGTRTLLSEMKTGKELYETIGHRIRLARSDKATSEFLLRAGIDGIKYPVNALSGGKGEKGYNYVVFDADQIQIKDHARYKPVPTAAEVAEAERQYAEVEAKYRGTDAALQNADKVYAMSKDEFIANTPIGYKYQSELGYETIAQVKHGVVVLTDAYFDHPADIRKDILYHEIAHNTVTKQVMANHDEFWRLTESGLFGAYNVNKQKWETIKGLAGRNSEEAITEAVSQYRMNPDQFTKKYSPELVSEVKRISEAGDSESRFEATKKASEELGIRYKPVPTAAEVAEAQRQYDEVEAKYRGTDGWLKAPNGKPTNLNERQWVQVRTKAFKAWFGDWEKDPAKYRVLLDNNGEPLQLYHGGTVDNVFDTTGKTSVGAFFTPSREGAEYYAYNAGEKVGEYFISPGKILNLTNENVLREWWNEQDGDSWFGISIDDVVGLLDSGSLYQDDMGRTQNAILDQARKDGYDTVIFQDATSGQVENSYVKFAPTQIKSATANVGTFDQSNPDIRYRKLTERERAMRDDVWNEIMGRPQKLRAETKPRVQTEPPERGQERKTEPPRPQPTRPNQSKPPTEAEIDVLSERIGKDLGIAPAQVKEKLGRQMMAAWREAQGDVSRLMESAAIRNFEEWVENNKPEGTDKKDLVWHWEEMLEYAAKVGLSREQIAQMVKSDRFDATAIGINLFQRMNYIGKLLVETEATLSDRNWGTPAEREQMEAQYGILQAQFDELQAAYAMQGSEAGTVLWTRRQNKAQYLENLTRAAQALESKINRGAVELGEMRQELDGLERTISDLEKSFEMLLRVMDGKRYKDITEMNDAELEAERQKQAEQLNDLRNRAEHLKYAIEQKVAAMQADKGRQEETQTQIRKIRKTGRKAKVIEIKERKPDVHDWIRAAWYNSVLAGVPTHLINMSANVVNSLLEDVATLFTQGGRVAGAQFAEKVRALFSNYEQLDPKTGEKIKTGAFAKAKEEFTSPQEFSKKNEVILKGNKLFMGIQFSTKFLGAEDMLAFFPNERGMLKSLAFDESKRTGRSVADLMENPTADMLRQAYYEAKRNTFNQNPEQYVGVLIDTINKFYGALDQSGGGGKAIGNLIRFNVLPFTRVLGNVLNATIDYTPLGMIRYFAYKSDNPNSLLNRQRKDQNGRPLWLDENGDQMVSPFRMRDARRQAARVALGTILGSLLYFLAMSADDDDDDKWFISGAGPQNYKKYKQLMAAGWRPYSIHIGNAIISYKEWPVSGAFAVVGNLHDIQKYDGKTRPQDWMDKTIYATMGVASSFLDRSFASNAISTATAFDRNDPKWVKRSLTSTTSSTIIPYNNMLRFIENTYNRNLYTPETIAQQAWASVPLVPKKGLPRRVNVFGMYERKDPATARLAMTDNVGLVVPDTQNTRKIFRTVRKNNLFLSETTKRELRVDPYVGKRGIPEEDKQHIWLQGKDHENFRVMRGTEYVRLLNESENYNLIMKYDKDKDKDEMAALLTSLGRKATAYATEETLKAYQRGELKHKYKTYNKSKEEE